MDVRSTLIREALHWAYAHPGIQKIQAFPDTEECLMYTRRLWACRQALNKIASTVRLHRDAYWMFGTPPPFFRSRLNDGATDEVLLEDWIAFMPAWGETIERYCESARRRDALAVIGQQSRAHSEDLRRAM